MLNKYYVCDIVSEKINVVIGSGIVKVWAWSSPEVAYDALSRNKPKDCQIVNFRRVK